MTAFPRQQNDSGTGDASAAALIVIEGIDGSGKGTQSKLLLQGLRSEGIRAELFSFPRYEQTFFGERVGDFLNGRFGSLSELDPFLVSLLYAGDRFESRPALQAAREANELVLCDRYVSSNVGHQTAKREGNERERLRAWIEHVEYDLFGLPRPDRVILLDIPVEQSQELIRRKTRRTYTDKAADLQEADTSYLEQVRRAYLDLARENPDWRIIPVTEGFRLRSIDEIAAEIRACVEEILSTRRGRSV